MRKNLDELHLMPEFCRDLGIGSLHLSDLSGMTIDGEQSIFKDSDDLTILRLAETVDSMGNKCSEYGITFAVNFRKALNSIKNKIRGINDAGQKDVKPYRCIRPWKNLFIYPDGKVMPSCECIVSAGNIFEHSMETVWNSQTMKSYRERMLEGNMKGWCSEQCIEGRINEEWLF